MTAYEIIPASIRHVRPMSRRIRAAGAITMQGYGVNPRIGLRQAFTASNYARTALIGGAPVAMWGVVGTLLGDTAFVWLVLAEETSRIPYAIVREARAEMQQAAEAYSRIMMTVLPDDTPSVRFALHLGFRPSDGEFLGDEASALTDPRFRIPIGDSYVVRMCYAPTAVN